VSLPSLSHHLLFPHIAKPHLWSDASHTGHQRHMIRHLCCSWSTSSAFFPKAGRNSPSLTIPMLRPSRTSCFRSVQRQRSPRIAAHPRMDYHCVAIPNPSQNHSLDESSRELDLSTTSRLATEDSQPHSLLPSRLTSRTPLSTMASPIEVSKGAPPVLT